MVLKINVTRPWL